MVKEYRRAQHVISARPRLMELFIEALIFGLSSPGSLLISNAVKTPVRLDVSGVRHAGVRRLGTFHAAFFLFCRSLPCLSCKASAGRHGVPAIQVAQPRRPLANQPSNHPTTPAIDFFFFFQCLRPVTHNGTQHGTLIISCHRISLQIFPGAPPTQCKPRRSFTQSHVFFLYNASFLAIMTYILPCSNTTMDHEFSFLLHRRTLSRVVDIH